MGVHIPNSRGHNKVWESVSPTQGATPKCGSPYPQLKGPNRSVGVPIPNSRGHTEAWESLSPTQGATPKRGSPYPQLKGPHQSVGVRIPNSRGLQRGRENCEPVILNSTGRITNWPGFLNSTGRLKAHNWADWLHHPCLLGVSEQKMDHGRNGYITRHSPSPQARAPTHTGKRGGGVSKKKEKESLRDVLPSVEGWSMKK